VGDDDRFNLWVACQQAAQTGRVRHAQASGPERELVTLVPDMELAR
jgi:hypothetical protein